MILSPVADQQPDPDCEHCGGDGVPQSAMHLILADEFSNKACPRCFEYDDEDT